MINLTKLPVLNENSEYLIDNSDYSELFPKLIAEEYLIVYSYNSDFLETIQELIQFNLEFSHHNCHLSDESYLLINIQQ